MKQGTGIHQKKYSKHAAPCAWKISVAHHNSRPFTSLCCRSAQVALSAPSKEPAATRQSGLAGQVRVWEKAKVAPSGVSFLS